MTKIAVIGLDCAPPDWIYGRWADIMPNLTALRREGIWGYMESTIPPITVPAWYSMFSGKSPGELGIYGFRNRSSYDYDSLEVVNSFDVKEKAIWQLLSERNKSSIVIGVPPSYPPKPLKGKMITGFLTPQTASNFTFPSSFKDELLSFLGGDYFFDVRDFRTDDKDRLLKDIYALTEQRLEVAKWLAGTKNWDLFVMVDMGPDRFNHGFWKFFDPSHPQYRKGNPYEGVAEEYYGFVDRKLGELINTFGEDTDILVASDHGAKAMKGGIAINQWLVKGGFLKFRDSYRPGTRVKGEMIDWKKTIAWAEGGYYSRIFLNVKGREPEGTVERKMYEKVRQEIIEFIKAIPDENGQEMATAVFRPEDIYPGVRKIPPDLIALLGNLDWRAIGTVGWDSMYLHRNDTGPDHANHAQYGMFVLYSKHLPFKGNIGKLKIYDVFNTIAERFDIKVKGSNGKSIYERIKEGK